jgi:hypothetical protein
LIQDRAGNPNSAYSLDGLSDFIQVPHHPSLNIDPNGFTAGLWVKASPEQVSFDAHYSMIDKSHSGGTPGGWTVQGTLGGEGDGIGTFALTHYSAFILQQCCRRRPHSAEPARALLLPHPVVRSAAILGSSDIDGAPPGFGGLKCRRWAL